MVRGGSKDDLANMVISCSPCNNEKAWMTGTEFKTFKAIGVLPGVRRSVSTWEPEHGPGSPDDRHSARPLDPVGETSA